MSDWIGMIGPRQPRPGVRERVLARALGARSRRAWLPAAAAVVLLATVSGLLSLRIARLERSVAATRDTLDLLRQPGTRVIPIAVQTGGGATGTRRGELTIFADSRSHRWLVTCHNFAPNTPGEAYQLWFVTDHGLRSAALMRMEHDAPMLMTLALPADSGVVIGVAMSLEPQRGSITPRGPMLFQVEL